MLSTDSGATGTLLVRNLASRNGDAMTYLVANEVYDHLEKVMDRLEDVANKISAIVIEHV